MYSKSLFYSNSILAITKICMCLTVMGPLDTCGLIFGLAYTYLVAFNNAMNSNELSTGFMGKR